MIPLLLVLACGSEKGPGEVSAPSSVYDTAGPVCDDPPVLSWENFGQGFVMESCQTCHATGSAYRAEADAPPPDDVVFDTHDDVLRLKEAILSSATGDDPRMPPSGGISAEDRRKLNIWLSCWED